MATVTSLTAERILQIAGGGGGIGPGGSNEYLLSEELQAALGQLQIELEQNTAMLAELNESTLPALEQTLAANDIALSELTEIQIVNLQAALEQNQQILAGIEQVDIPLLQQDVSNVVVNDLARPKQYVQEDEPTNPDVEDRELIVGDTWVTPSNNIQHIWNGVAWSAFNVEISDFSLTVKKFLSTKHQIY